MSDETVRGSVCVVVFARTPVLGRVKQRLAESVGDDVALEVYKELFFQTLKTVDESASDNYSLAASLRYLGPRPEADSLGSFRGRLEKQYHLDMVSNLVDSLNAPLRNGFRGSLVLGADHPTLTAADIGDLALLLDQYPVAVGPTEDGGFWGFATTLPVDEILKDVAMGTDRACETLLTACGKHGHDCGLGPMLWDVDDEEDLLRWRRHIASKK